jgi:pimeloyl-ACP methyl ester carboxylesterase
LTVGGGGADADPWADPRLRTALERTLDLGPARLRLRDWPGRGGPLVHAPDPSSPTEGLITAIATAFAPELRVLSLAPRTERPYQQHALDLLALLDQFGFQTPLLVGEGRGCLAALLIAAWIPSRVRAVVLVQPSSSAPPDGLFGLSLADGPSDIAALRQRLRCPSLDLLVSDSQAVRQLGDFLRSV